MTTTTKTPLILAALCLLFAGSGVQAGFDEGMNYFKAGKYLEAAAEFQELVDESPDYDYGHFMLGVCYVKTGKPGDGERSFLRAIELNGDKFEYHFALANVYQQKGQFANVISTLNTAEPLVPEPHKYNFYQLRGFAEASSKDWEPAIADLEKAAAIKTDPTVLTQLGKAYFSVGQYAKAVEKLNAASRLEPENAEIYQLTAEALLNVAAKEGSEAQKERRYGEALTSAEKYLSKAPNDKEARYLVGRAALGAGKYDEAVEAFTKVLDKDPDHCNAMANLGKAFVAKKDWPNALRSLENATTCSPGMAIAWQNKGFVLQKMGSEQKSVEHYEQAIGAYTQANQLKPAATNDQGIETCKQNIDVLKHNINVAQLEQQQEEEAARLQREYEEQLAKEKEWEKKREDGD